MRERILVGYDLGNNFSQISYSLQEDAIPETLPVIAGTENFNIPTVLCKRKSVNQWFFGKEACRYAEEEDGILLTNLVELAKDGEPIIIEEEEFDPVLLLALFVKRSLSMLSVIAPLERIEALMVTCDNMDKRMVEILECSVAGLGLKTDHVFYQSHVESFYYYMIYQPTELWLHQVLVFDYIDSDTMKVYRMECNQRTQPIVAFIDEHSYPFPVASDAKLFELVQDACDGRIITSAYLVGEGFNGEWMQESLRYLCRNRRVFQGNNLYSKGACFNLLEQYNGSDAGRSHVFLGNDKLKSNIGMKALRNGTASYYAILDAGVSWYDARNEFDFFLANDNTFQIVVTPLNGKNIRDVEIVLEGLPIRDGAAARLHMCVSISGENRLVFEIEDLGFGQIYSASKMKWIKHFDL